MTRNEGILGIAQFRHISDLEISSGTSMSNKGFKPRKTMCSSFRFVQPNGFVRNTVTAPVAV